MALTTGFALPKFNWRRGKHAWDRHTWLYVSVLIAVVLGAVVGLVWPEIGQGFEALGKGFVALIKMMIAPIIFCTIVVGVGSIAKAATVGKIGGLALLYFMVMSTFALAIGLLVGNIIHPGAGLDMASATYDAADTEAKTTQEFILGIIPTTFFSAFTGESVLQVLFIALLVGFALQGLGERGAPIMEAVKQLQKLVFRILGMILWLAPIGAFGAIAAVVGKTGIAAIWSLGILMGAFYITCILFIVVVLGALLWTVARVNIFSLMKYLGREYLLIVGTSSSESALPRLIAKMEFVGVSKPVVGITVPTGYSFNLDGTAIYLTMASLFIATGMGQPMSIGEQIGLLVFMIIASKGAAGVTGAGLATLAGGLQAYRPDLVDGVGVIVGIDRFMSEGRALTNFTGNAVATLLIGTWTKQIDRARVRRVLGGELPFDESLLDGVDAHATSGGSQGADVQDLREAALTEMAAKEERARMRAGSA
ncbi:MULTISPECIES: cation:dicarboxylate symporter family transporter [Microbacterium]|uniref:cation:dicarboxylate symporter family transporter n=1 Tax=Microbacterium TaxID=33882 RepID=UPI000CAD092F|nr:MULTISPECIES: cation:dicarboxylase symporter family transporter [Microbacterium]PKQ33120.1 MAG: C4-dicarboxylate transporter DctA [Actinobacteria bacterium HGW-Actinobacteria-11]MCK8477340.1 cation:dicarboxylase symporter family transporter [Microbacterium aurugineum]MCZ4300723.1 cation:dicarboxylase symporter family transporter [Microbacterium oxydans]QEA29269.1 cation:dicarboxylase symporter family transporter [Microbacterium sp. CBA3102]TCJ29503.1 cation:dicarboxylase symporter family tr